MDLTYPEVGATAGQLPDGYRHIHERRRIGHGREVFDAASTALLTWKMHERAGVRRVSGPQRAIEGHDVAFSWLVLRFECRVVYVVEEEGLRGFAYGTLPRHPECGEERFLVHYDAETQIVSATITAFSRPANSLVHLGGPVSRLVQARMTRRYLASLV